MATAARKTNWFAIWITIAVVVIVVAVTGVVIAMNNAATATANAGGAKPTASNIVDGAIVFGDKGTDTVATYVDFLCPYCNQFEQTEGSTIKQLVDDGKVKLELHPVSILDNNSNPAGYSSRAASAMYSVAIHDPANAYAFMQAMYQNQPKEQSAGLTDDQIVTIAKNAGVNMTAELQKEITSNKYQKYALTQSLPQGATGTPTVMVNDKLISVTFDPRKDIVANLTQ